MPNSQVTYYHLPKTVADWPWPRRMNPHYEEVKRECTQWFTSLHVFSPQSQKAFDRCDLCRLAALSNITSTKKQLRTACDLMMLFFSFDDYTHDATVETVQNYADIVMDALRRPRKARPRGEVVLGKVAQQFWRRGSKLASKTSKARFLASFEVFLKAEIAQARDREHHSLNNVDDYLRVRRYTIGVDPAYVMLELGYDLPDEVFHHPVVAELRELAIQMIILDNDMCSYNKEQASEKRPHNILTVLMSQLGYDLNTALQWVHRRHSTHFHTFIQKWKQLPQWSPEVRPMAENYIHGIANWVRSNDCWNFESGRYFGAKGKEIQVHRVVALLPRTTTPLIAVL